MRSQTPGAKGMYVLVPEQLYAQFRLTVAARGVTIQAAVADIMEKYVTANRGVVAEAAAFANAD
jgi:hypothetical protein